LRNSRIEGLRDSGIWFLTIHWPLLTVHCLLFSLKIKLQLSMKSTSCALSHCICPVFSIKRGQGYRVESNLWLVDPRMPTRVHPETPGQIPRPARFPFGKEAFFVLARKELALSPAEGGVARRRTYVPPLVMDRSGIASRSVIEPAGVSAATAQGRKRTLSGRKLTRDIQFHSAMSAL
jgi:hypothetical protein